MPRWSIVLLVAFGSMGAGYLYSRFALKRASLQPSHKGLLLGGVAAAIVFLIHFILESFGIDLTRGNPKHIFEGVLSVVFLSIPARMMYVRLRSGPELADLGPPPLGTMLRGIGGLLILMAAGGLIGRWFTVGQGMVSMTQGIALATLGFTHSQIRSGGICHGESMLRWNRIARFEWTSGGVLTIDLKRPRWWQDRVQLPVPAVLESHVDALMHRHITGNS